MSSISKEEDLVIDKMFSRLASENELALIKRIILDVHKSNGLYHDSIRHNGDLHSLKFRVAEVTGLNIQASGELARSIWFVVKHNLDLEKMNRAGIKYGTWNYNEHICQYIAHSKLHGQKFLINKGIRIGIFKHIYPGKMVGCSCWIKPELPF